MRHLFIFYISRKIKKAKLKMEAENNGIVKKALNHYIDNLETTKLFLSVNTI